MVKITAIICTYNRAHILPCCINSLMNQKFLNGKYEVLVVDNNSNDDTKGVVKKLQKSFNNLRYVFEKNQGLSHARNKGIENAEGKIIVFIDDEAVASSDWLQSHYNAHKKYGAKCVGGRIKLAWPEKSAPEWLKRTVWHYYGYYDAGPKAIEVKGLGKLLPGGNTSYKKEIFNIVGLFNTELGRTGKSLIGGEDTLMCYNLEKYNIRMFYEPKALIHHMVLKERLSYKYLKTVAINSGRTDRIVYRYVDSSNYGKILFFLRSIWKLLVSIISLLKNVAIKEKNKELSSKLAIYRCLGKLR